MTYGTQEGCMTASQVHSYVLYVPVIILALHAVMGMQRLRQ